MPFRRNACTPLSDHVIAVEPNKELVGAGG